MKDQRTPFKTQVLWAIHSVIRSDPKKPKRPWVNLVGRPLPLSQESELHEVLRQAGIERILHFSDASTVEELDDMGLACLNIGLEQRAKLSCVQMERRHKIPYVLLESSLLPEKIHQNYVRLSDTLHTTLDAGAAAEAVEQELAALRPRLQGLKIAVGEHIQRRPFEAAAELAQLGFPIDCIFTLSLQGEDLPFVETIRSLCPQCRVYFSGTPEILSYCRAPETFDLVLGLNGHYYAQSPTTAALSVDARYGDYHSILSFLRKVGAALDRTGAKKTLDVFLDKNNQYDQQNLRKQLRTQAEQRVREMSPNACLKQWGVYHREEA